MTGLDADPAAAVEAALRELGEKTMAQDYGMRSYDELMAAVNAMPEEDVRRITRQVRRWEAAAFRVVIPGSQTTGYSYLTTGTECPEVVGRYTAEYNEEYEADFATLEEAQAYVARRIGVAPETLRWTQVQDGRGIPGWDCQYG